MRILMINSVCGIRSTGRICTQMAEKFVAEGHEVKIAYGRESLPEDYRDIAVRIGSEQSVYVNALQSRFTDREGFYSKKATKCFLKWAEAYDPDMLWLHNLHGYYINVEMLFDWIKTRPAMQVKWTLHDCWAFTGHCAHFSYVQCSKWKNGCHRCSQKRQYPVSMLADSSEKNYLRKKAAFCGVSNMTLIVPSNWLANLVGQSFLKEYPVEVVPNTIDTDTFRPTPGNFREKYSLQDRKIILGVASAWSQRKGLYDFFQLADLLDEQYKIVLVGLTAKQIKKVPDKILCIPVTNSKQELAEIYTAADIFVNPSREETFGLTTIEALACGTPAIVYQNTACEEIVATHGGVAVEQSVQALKNAILAQIG